MTPEGVVVWLAGLVVAPLLAGLLKRYAIKVADEAAFMLAFAVSLLLALLVQLVYGGGLHLPADLTDLTSEAAIVLALATAAYKVIYPVLLPVPVGHALGLRPLDKAA